MSDPFRSPPGTNPPRHVRPRNNAALGWVLGVIAVIVVIGAAYWGMTAKTRTAADQPAVTTGQGGNVANPPAVTAAPAPAAGVPAPPPETTTGRTAPPARP